MILILRKAFVIYFITTLISIALASTTFAAIPIEVGLYKSVLVNLKKKMVLVAVASTQKTSTEKNEDNAADVFGQALAKNPTVIVKTQTDKAGVTDNLSNKFVTLELISPYVIKLDGVTIGSTGMIIWTKDDKDEKAEPAFYDINVVGNRDAIESKLNEISPIDPITVQFANDTVILSGNVANEQTRVKAENTAKAFAPKVLNHITIDNPKQVLLQVKVAQVDKTALKKLGISALIKGKTAEGFSNTIAAPSGGSSGGSSGGTGILGSVAGLTGFTPLDAFQLGVSYFPSGIGAVITALVTKGHAKILAEPNLLVKSGQEGNFLAGSKIPYNVLIIAGGTSTPTIIWQEVGIKLKFKPEVLENGLINLKIDPAEVSSIAGTLAVNGYPIIDSRSVNTNVELRDGESLVMAGLLQEDEINTMSKIPLLGDIPILGALFRSTQKDLKEKELVFFVTPIIVKSLAPGAKSELPTDKKLTPEEEKDLKWIPLGN